MDSRRIKVSFLDDFREYLIREEKSSATVEKYLRDMKHFSRYVQGQDITKELVIAYKASLQEHGYAVRSINSMLASLNSFLEFMNWKDLKVKTLRCQRQTYCTKGKELTRVDYLKLLEASKFQVQLHLVIQTICATGIRVSELKFFTVEAVRQGEIIVQCKNKTRTIFVPGNLRKILLSYAKKSGVKEGIIFLNKKGMPLDRSSIWVRMKKLCASAGINPSKVFPHNLRKLFARTFYKIEKDIAKLADILGHSSINTTRIYIMTTGSEHRKKIESLGLVIFNAKIT